MNVELTNSQKPETKNQKPKTRNQKLIYGSRSAVYEC